MKNYKIIHEKYSRARILGRLVWSIAIMLLVCIGTNTNAQYSSGYQTAVYGKTDKDKYKPAPIMVCANDTTVTASISPCSASVVLNPPTIGPLCPPSTGPTFPPLPFPPSPYSGSTVVTWKLAYGDGDTISCIQHVTVTGPPPLTTTATSCNAYTWAVNGATYTASGVYTYTAINPVGCPTTSVLNLTINSSTVTSTTITACDSYTWNGTTYTASGVYTYTSLNAQGCNNTATLNLTINQSTTSSSSITVCDTYTWPLNGMTYISSGVYTQTTLNANGCVNTATLNLSINQSVSTTINVTANDTYTWSCNGTTYTTSGIYICTSLNASGCVNTSTLNLTIYYSTTSSITVYSCTPYFWPESTITYTVSGTYTHVSLNPNGSTNTATLVLIITTAATVNTSFTLAKSVYCLGDVITAATQMPSLNTDPTLVNQWLIYNATSNCVPIFPSTPIVTNYGNTFSKVLNSTQFIPGHCYVLQHGMYSDCLPYTSTIICFCISPTTETQNITASCAYSWACNGQTYTASGAYTCTTINVNGCTVTKTLNLTITPPPTITISGNTNVCAGHTTILTPSGASTYTITPGGSTTIPFIVAAGTYTITGTSSNGCSNTTSVTVTVVPCGVKISAKVFLAGPYNETNGLMNDDLRAASPNSLLPLSEPYTAPPFYKLVANEPAGETTTTAVRSISGANAIIDWVFLELRNQTLPYGVLSTRRALLKRNGFVVDVDGVSPVSFPNTPSGSYYVSIKHRNHLGVMTAVPFTLNNTSTSIDFTSGLVWVNPSISVPPYNVPRRTQSSPTNGSVYTLWGGDANADKKVKYIGLNYDKDPIYVIAGPVNNICGVYRVEDLNMNGCVRYNGPVNDKDVIINNIFACLQNGPPPGSGYILYQHTPD